MFQKQSSFDALSWFDLLEEEMEMENLFDPVNILDKRFKVSFFKVDGSVAIYEGTLVDPNTFTQDQILEYCIGLETKHLIPIITEKGWKSFYKDKVIAVVLL